MSCEKLWHRPRPPVLRRTVVGERLQEGPVRPITRPRHPRRRISINQDRRTLVRADSFVGRGSPGTRRVAASDRTEGVYAFVGRSVSTNSIEGKTSDQRVRPSVGQTAATPSGAWRPAPNSRSSRGDRSGGGRMEDGGLLPGGAGGRFLDRSTRRRDTREDRQGTQVTPLVETVRIEKDCRDRHGNSARATRARARRGALRPLLSQRIFS